MSGANPYTLEALSGAAARVLYAPLIGATGTVSAVPTGLAQVFAQVAPYAPVAPYLDLGATSGPFSYSRALTTAGYAIEQELEQLLQQPTDLTRTIKVAVAEIRKETLAILDFGNVSALAAAAGASAADVVTVGAVQTLPVFRVCFVVARQTAQGAVVEPGGAIRGRFLGFAAYRAQITTDTVDLSYGKAALASASLTLTLQPEPAIADTTQNQGSWFDETAGTIAA